VTVSGDGVHDLEYRSTDNAGNVEATKSAQVKIGVPPSTTEHAWDLVVVGKYAYLADGEAGLKVFDVAVPATPTLVATCDTPGTAQDVSVMGRYAYVADGVSGLQVVDVGDPTRPRVVGSLPTPSAAQNVALSLGRIYEDYETSGGWVTDAGTVSLDTSNVKHGAGALRLTAAAGGIAKAHKDNLGWDLSRDKDNLQLWIYVESGGAVPGSYSRYATISLSNANNYSNYFKIVPNLHEGWNQLRFNSADWQAVGAPSWQKPIQRFAIAVPAPTDSVAAVSIDDLRGGVSGLAPAFVWTFDDGYDEVYTEVLPYLSTRGQRGTVYLTPNFVGRTSYLTVPHLQSLYSAGWAIGNHTIDHKDLSSLDQATARTKIQLGYEWLMARGFTRAARHLAYPFNKFSHTAIAAAAQAGVLSARRGGYRNTPLPLDDPFLLCSFSFDDSTQTVDAWKNKIDSAVASGSTLVFYGHYFTATTYPVFQGIADYLASKGVWCPPIDEWWNTLVAETTGADAYAGRYAYVSCGASGLQVIDVGNPSNPKLVGSIASAGSSVDVAATDSYAVVADGVGGLQIVNAANPASPSRVASAATTGPARGVAVAEGLSYVAEGAAGLEVFSLKTPASPIGLGASDTPGDARDVAVSGTYAYVADGPAGLRIISVANPNAPVEVASRQLSGEAEAVFVMGDYLYVAAGSAGLQVVPALSP